jgi:hypothetical protein
MGERTVTITPCQLELCQTQQGIFGLGRQRIIHDEVFVITLGIRGIRSECRPPE